MPQILASINLIYKRLKCRNAQEKHFLIKLIIKTNDMLIKSNHLFPVLFVQSPLLKYGLYYNIVTCTLAYVLMIIPGWRIHRFIRLNLRGSTTDKQKQRTLDIQRQLTRVLIIQACLTNLMLIYST
jgi:hypothetical protein